MAYEDLLTDPLFAIGYGLLTSKQNPIGTGMDMLMKGEDSKRKQQDSEWDRKYKQAQIQAELAKAGQPKLEFNPVTGEIVDMRTGTVQGSNSGFGGETPPPLDTAGLTPEEFAALTPLARKEAINANIRTKADKRKSQSEAIIPNYDLSGDALPTTANVTQAQQFAALVPAYESALKDVKEKIAKYGSTTGWGTDTKEVDQSMNQLMQLERTINATGVLNLGEKPILEESYATFDPRSILNLAKSKEDMLKSADDYLALRKNMINAKLQGFGYKPKNTDILPPQKTPLPQSAAKLGISQEEWLQLSPAAQKELSNGQ